MAKLAPPKRALDAIGTWLADLTETTRPTEIRPRLVVGRANPQKLGKAIAIAARDAEEGAPAFADSEVAAVLMTVSERIGELDADEYFDKPLRLRFDVKAGDEHLGDKTFLVLSPADDESGGGGKGAIFFGVAKLLDSHGQATERILNAAAAALDAQGRANGQQLEIMEQREERLGRVETERLAALERALRAEAGQTPIEQEALRIFGPAVASKFLGEKAGKVAAAAAGGAGAAASGPVSAVEGLMGIKALIDRMPKAEKELLQANPEVRAALLQLAGPPAAKP